MNLSYKLKPSIVALKFTNINYFFAICNPLRASERSPFEGSCCGGGYANVDSVPPSPDDDDDDSDGSDPPPPAR